MPFASCRSTGRGSLTFSTSFETGALIQPDNAGHGLRRLALRRLRQRGGNR